MNAEDEAVGRAWEIVRVVLGDEAVARYYALAREREMRSHLDRAGITDAMSPEARAVAVDEYIRQELGLPPGADVGKAVQALCGSPHDSEFKPRHDDPRGSIFMMMILDAARAVRRTRPERTFAPVPEPKSPATPEPAPAPDALPEAIARRINPVPWWIVPKAFPSDNDPSFRRRGPGPGSRMGPL